MLLNSVVNIPSSGKVSVKKIKGVSYVYYQYANNYSSERGYNLTKRACIGKVCTDSPKQMHPNSNYLKYFPDESLPEFSDTCRSSCLKVGTYVVISKILQKYHLPSILKDIIGDKYGLFLDLIAYTIICENNASQYYPEYAYNHPLFTMGMKIYSDSSVSSFLHELTIDDSVRFLNRWNEGRNHTEKIYISYDSTNKKCQAGDIDIVEIGHSKEGIPDNIFNSAIAYDRTNRVPLLYETYCGSIVDVVQLTEMIDKIRSLGYKKAGFILDRGYFSESNIHYMDRCGYDFIIMMKGMKSIVKDLILTYRGTFEDSWDHTIPEYGVSGTSIEKTLFKTDSKNRYIHIYFDSYKAASEKTDFIQKINEMTMKLKEYIGTDKAIPDVYRQYFDLIYWHQGKEDEKFTAAVPRKSVIEEEMKIFGYFCIITSEKMTAREALLLYKSRDDSEKLFRGDKSYLGERAERVYSNESVQSKIFIEFVALIVRSRIYVDLIEQMKKEGKHNNYMTVPAAIRELEKIEMIRYGNKDYQLDHALTKNQKTILKAFDMDQRMMIDQINALSIQLSTVTK